MSGDRTRAVGTGSGSVVPHTEQVRVPAGIASPHTWHAGMDRSSLAASAATSILFTRLQPAPSLKVLSRVHGIIELAINLRQRGMDAGPIRPDRKRTVQCRQRLERPIQLL